jgi:hypothetical protein
VTHRAFTSVTREWISCSATQEPSLRAILIAAREMAKARSSGLSLSHVPEKWNKAD